MMVDKSLSIALLISMIFHALLFLPLMYFKSAPFKKRLPSLRITYLVPKKVPAKKVSLKKRKEVPVARPETDSSYKAENKPIKKIVSAPKPASEDIKIEIPPELPKEKEALYLNYYQTIRERIRNFVLENYPRFIACGEVCLYFVLLSDGSLKEIKVVEERSSQNRLLKDVAEKSVSQAAPFSSFPKDLSQAQLSFNVIISFELEN